MTDAIGLLEKIGSNSTLRYADRDALEALATDSGIDAQSKAAILAQDRRSAELALGLARESCAIIFPVDPGE